MLNRPIYDSVWSLIKICTWRWSRGWPWVSLLVIQARYWVNHPFEPSSIRIFSFKPNIEFWKKQIYILKIYIYFWKKTIKSFFINQRKKQTTNVEDKQYLLENRFSPISNFDTKERIFKFMPIFCVYIMRQLRKGGKEQFQKLEYLYLPIKINYY